VTGAASLAQFGINDAPNWVATAAAGTRYRLTAWVRSTTSHGGLTARIREYSNGALVGAVSASPILALTSDWQRVEVEHVVSAAGATLDLQVLDSPVAPGEQFEIDDIVIAPVTLTTTAVAPGAAPPQLTARVAPNPARAASVLEFDLPRAAEVSVRLFDVRGRDVGVVLDRIGLFAGTHRVPLGAWLTARRLPSGVYFCRVDSPAGCAIRRFVVLD
jgi:hypothetical protein